SERDSMYWNVSDVLNRWQHRRSYTDFEGLAAPGPVARLVRDALSNDSTDQPLLAQDVYVEADPSADHTLEGGDAAQAHAFIRDMLLHYCYETADQAGPEFLPNEQELATTAHILAYVFNGSARFMKVSEEDYQTALNTYIDEENPDTE